jgi:hypothetical protein
MPDVPQSYPGRGANFTRKMPLKEFVRILDEIVPRYGKPQINLEGSGEPTMTKDLLEYIKQVKKRGLNCFMYCNEARLNGKFMNDVIDFLFKLEVVLLILIKSFFNNLFIFYKMRFFIINLVPAKIKIIIK